jgi:hypothetical protein
MPRKKSSAQSPKDPAPLTLVQDGPLVLDVEPVTPSYLPVLVKQPHGGALQRGGTPGNKGGGRPKNEFKAICRELTTREATLIAVMAILEDPKHEHYMSALKWASEHGYGKATETIENNTTVTVKQEWTFGGKTVAF